MNSTSSTTRKMQYILPTKTEIRCMQRPYGIRVLIALWRGKKTSIETIWPRFIINITIASRWVCMWYTYIYNPKSLCFKDRANAIIVEQHITFSGSVLSMKWSRLSTTTHPHACTYVVDVGIAVCRKTQKSRVTCFAL